MEALTQRKISEFSQELFSIESQALFEEEISSPQQQSSVTQKDQRKSVKSSSYPQNGNLQENLEKNSQKNSKIQEKQNILFKKYSNYSPKKQKNKGLFFQNRLNQIQIQNKIKIPIQNEETQKNQILNKLEVMQLRKRQQAILLMKRKILKSQCENQRKADQFKITHKMKFYLQLIMKEKQIQQRANQLIRKMNYDENYREETTESLEVNLEQKKEKALCQESMSKLFMISSFLEKNQNVIMYVFLIISSILFKSLY